MFKIQLKIKLTKETTKEIETALYKVLDELKKKQEFNYTVKDLTFEITSPSYTATDLLVQFDKQAKVILGKEFKITIKEIEIIHYEIQTELEEIPVKKFTIPFAKRLEFTGNNLCLVYGNIPFSYIHEQYVEKSIKLIKDKIKAQQYEGKDEFKEYVWEGKQRNCTYTKDPAVELEEQGWIKRTDAKGQFIYGRRFTVLMNVLKELYTKNIYEKFGFFEMTFPKFEPWAVPMKSGHAKNVYPNAYFVNVPRNSDPEDWQEVMDLFVITGEIAEEKIRQKSVCVGIMSYAQCPPFWPFLRNRVIDEQTLPLLVYDWSGPTYRNEAGGTHGLDRVEELHRVETLFVGTKEQVVKQWQELQRELIRFYDHILDLEIKVANVTPWWMAHAGVKTVSEQQDIGTYDIDIYLPFRGDRTKEWLEVQNISSNGDKYPKAFNIKGKNLDYLWSGCAGTSFERMIVSFLAQKGLDTKKWPKEVRERFEERTKNIKELVFY